MTSAVLRSVPRPFLIFASITFVSSLVMLFWGAWTVGVTWDEKTHVAFLQAYFDIGWNTDPKAIVNNAPDPRYIWGIYVYGPVGELVGHAVSVLFGAEQWGRPTFDAFSSSTRHVGTALSALVGILAVGGIVKSITTSWRWGVVAAAMIAATPLWIGHGMFNIKDTPVAAGYTVATLGIVVLLRSAAWPSRRVPALGVALILAGTVMAAGTRAASGVPIAAAAFLGALGWWLLVGREAGFRDTIRPALTRLGSATGALVVAYLVLVLLYPNAFANPFVLAWQALVVSARFPFDETVLTAGTWMSQPPPWTYLPLWFGAQLPLLILVSFVGFSVLWVAWAIRRLALLPTAVDGAQVAASGVVLLQAFLLPVLAILGRSNMYNGERQFLFVVPAAVGLSTLGLWAFHQWFSSRWAGRRVPEIGFWGIVGVGIAAPMVAQISLFPYNYVYYNAAVASQPLEDHWPTDYWRASSNELWRRLPATGPEACAYESFRYDRIKTCAAEGMFQPYLAERGTSAVAGQLGENEIWMIRENQGLSPLPTGCVVHDEVTRRLFGQEVVIGQILKCELPKGWSIEDSP